MDDYKVQVETFMVEFGDTESLLYPYNERQMDEYVWIVVIGSFVSFFVAFGIGANDVANAFATSVGSGAISIGQALAIAAVFEFSGAFFLGAQVTDTVRRKIADPEYFYSMPEVFMYGNLSALTATGFWLLLASYLELPVSTTHSIVGGVIGFAITVDPDAIMWSASKDEFPYFEGVSAIVASWFISPLISGVFAGLLFFLVRWVVLRHEKSYERSFIFFPILVFFTVFINILFILIKGADAIESVEEMALWKKVVISLACGALVGIVTGVVAISLKKKLDAYFEGRADKPGTKDEKQPNRLDKFFGKIFRGVDVDVHEVIESEEAVSSVHENQEKFDIKTEEAFKYLQVFTAICDSFSHGANDVANSIGPFAAIVTTYEVGRLNKKSEVPRWILAFGGVGIVVGLGTYGYKIMRAIGVKLVAVTPSRGFAIELGAAIVIAVGSYLGLPLSTTHCQVGAEIGVGMLEGHMGVNWRLMGKIFAGWVVTLIVTGIGSAALFSYGAFGPSIQMSDQINMWRHWAGGFTEGVRQALVANQQAGVEITTNGIALTSDPSKWPSEKNEDGLKLQTDAFREEDPTVQNPVWNTVLPHELELLTNYADGIQDSVFQDWSIGPKDYEDLLNEDATNLKPLDKIVLLLNEALLGGEKWKIPFNVLDLDSSEGIEAVEVVPPPEEE